MIGLFRYSRGFSTSPVYVEYHGNFHFSNWVLTPEWNIQGAEHCYPAALKAFQETQRTFPDGLFTIAEISSMNGKNTVQIVTKLGQELRAKSNRELMILPTFLPIGNWNDYFKYALAPDKYGSIANTYVAARPGSHWKRLYPDKFLNFIYSNDSFIPISKIRVAPDTIWPTFTKDPEIIKESRATAIKDMDTLLTLRGQEVKSGGHFCLDILVDNVVPKESAWAQYIDIIHEYVASGRITQEERSKMAIRNFQRDESMVDEALHKQRENWRVVYRERSANRNPLWFQYEKDNDAVRLARDYSASLREWAAGAIVNSLAPTRTPEEKKALMDEIFEELTRRLIPSPCPLDPEAIDMVLLKL